MLAWMIEEKNIEPNVQVWDKPSARTTAFRVAISTGMKSPRNTAAPTGNVLHSEWRTLKNERSHVTKVSTIFFRSRQTDYAAFPMKAKYCPNTSIRKIVRSAHGAACAVARCITATPEYVRSRHEREKVEMLGS